VHATESPPQQNLHLLGGHLVGVLGGPDALHVEGGGPTLADEVELCDELVSPSGHDRLAGRVARRMVIVALSQGLHSASHLGHTLMSTA
jgi:hypothetical protein